MSMNVTGRAVPLRCSMAGRSIVPKRLIWNLIRILPLRLFFKKYGNIERVTYVLVFIVGYRTEMDLFLLVDNPVIWRVNPHFIASFLQPLVASVTV